MITGDLNQRDRTTRRDATDIEYEQLKLLNGRYKSKYSQHQRFLAVPDLLQGNVTRNSKNFGVNLPPARPTCCSTPAARPSEQITGSVAATACCRPAPWWAAPSVTSTTTPYRKPRVTAAMRTSSATANSSWARA
jgi:hypothetical protein